MMSVAEQTRKLVGHKIELMSDAIIIGKLEAVRNCEFDVANSRLTEIVVIGDSIF